MVGLFSLCSSVHCRVYTQYLGTGYEQCNTGQCPEFMLLPPILITLFFTDSTLKPSQSSSRCVLTFPCHATFFKGLLPSDITATNLLDITVTYLLDITGTYLLDKTATFRGQYWTPDIHDLTHDFFGFLFVLVLLSAHVERVSVSRMRIFM